MITWKAIKELVRDLAIILGFVCLIIFPFVLWWVAAWGSYLLIH